MREMLLNIVVVVPPLMSAVILHEIAHGLVAERLGDPTARQAGRITLNPLKHIDFRMTILLPALLMLAGAPVFGGAKPVPVNPGYFHSPRKGMMWVAIAGPISNALQAAIWYGMYLLALPGPNQLSIGYIQTIVLGWCVYGILINILLAVFNLIPIPPLDGGRVLVGVLPLPLARRVAKLERYGLLLVAFLLLSGVLDKILSPLLHFAETYVLN